MEECMDWVAVLDDSSSRVAWLREHVPSSYDIVHAVRVNTFFEKVRVEETRRRRPPALMILDHDLGIGSFEDIDGHNGMHAVERIVAYGDVVSPRFLVWSTNDAVRDEMVRRLAASFVAFGGARDQAAVAIPFRAEQLREIDMWLHSVL